MGHNPTETSILCAGIFIYFFHYLEDEHGIPAAQKAPFKKLFLSLSLLTSHSAPTPLLSPLSTFFYMVSSPFFLRYLYSFSFPFSYFSELAQSSPWVGASFPFLVLCLGWQSLGYVEKSLCSFPELWAAWDFLEMPLNLVGPFSFAQMFEVLLAGSAVVIECYWYISWKTHHSLETGLFF